MVNYVLTLEGKINVRSIFDLKHINSFTNSGKKKLSTFYFEDTKTLVSAKNCLFQEGIKEKAEDYMHFNENITLKTYREKDDVIKDILKKHGLQYILQTNEVTINSS
jgi:hypothetical protein